MRMYDCIVKKKLGGVLTNEEIQFIIRGYMEEAIPDYQMASMLMAIYFKGMTDEELLNWTLSMAKSGEMVDLSSIEGIKIDKHSTGGVGDKTTLVIAPIVAACGVKVAKMSGRGLGFTGGTIDKLESIPGYQTDLSNERFVKIVNEVGCSIVGQSKDLAPADKKLYALRDVTATVDSIPLIAASIMSKKLAAGNDGILIDVTMGSGAFMKRKEDAVTLAKKMVEIGGRYGKKTVAILTDMDNPLGNAIGNRMEVLEAIETLQGKGPEDLKEVCYHLAANMLYLANMGDMDSCMQMVDDTIQNGKAFKKFMQMLQAHGGKVSFIENPELWNEAPYQMTLNAEEPGIVTGMDTEGVGIASCMLGAGRTVKDEKIDKLAGIRLYKKTGDLVKKGDALATLHTSDKERLKSVKERLKECYIIKELGDNTKRVVKESLIRERFENA